MCGHWCGDTYPMTKLSFSICYDHETGRWHAIRCRQHVTTEGELFEQGVSELHWEPFDTWEDVEQWARGELRVQLPSICDPYNSQVMQVPPQGTDEGQVDDLALDRDWEVPLPLEWLPAS